MVYGCSKQCRPWHTSTKKRARERLRRLVSGHKPHPENDFLLFRLLLQLICRPSPTRSGWQKKKKKQEEKTKSQTTLGL